MANFWTTIPNTDVDVDSPLTTALITALRDNPEGIAQRATGAPKIFGVPYDYQELVANGNWVKPANAETGDIVVVHVVAGGGAGARSGTNQGGQGGGGVFYTFEDIDLLGSTEPVVVGAGAPASAGIPGTDGGTSTFGTAGVAVAGVAPNYLEAEGGNSGGSVAAKNDSKGRTTWGNLSTVAQFADYLAGAEFPFRGGYGGYTGAGAAGGGNSVYGGGGGGTNVSTAAHGSGGFSAKAGRGGQGTRTTGGAEYQIDGEFPGGGGGGTVLLALAGAGADGVVRVWCIRREA
jgi:hypothetical protein